MLLNLFQTLQRESFVWPKFFSKKHPPPKPPLGVLGGFVKNSLGVQPAGQEKALAGKKVHPPLGGGVRRAGCQVGPTRHLKNGTPQI